MRSDILMHGLHMCGIKLPYPSRPNSSGKRNINFSWKGEENLIAIVVELQRVQDKHEGFSNAVLLSEELCASLLSRVLFDIVVFCL